MSLLRGVHDVAIGYGGRALLSGIERRPGLSFGYVPQRGVIDDIFPLPALDVVVMGWYPRIGSCRRVTRADRELALRHMERVGIAHLARRPFRSGPGGQKQRTLIARGLVPEPDVLVLDEPTDGVDIAGETGIMELISHLQRGSGRTLLIISRSFNLVANHAGQPGRRYVRVPLCQVAPQPTAPPRSSLPPASVYAGYALCRLTVPLCAVLSARGEGGRPSTGSYAKCPTS